MEPVRPVGVVWDQLARVADVGELQQAAEELGWELEYTQLERGDFDGQYRVADLRNVVVELEHWGRAVQIRGVFPANTVCVHLAQSIREPASFHGARLGWNDLLLAPGGTEANLITRAHYRSITMQVDRDRFFAAQRALLGTDGLEEQLVLRLSPEEADRLRTIAALTFDSTLGRIAELEGELVEAVVRQLEPGRTRDIVRPTEHVAVLARDYIHAHLNGRIRMQDLCTATGTPERTLRRAFMSAFGVSETVYVRSHRLRRARVLLQGAARSVTEAALASGFEHLGRFSHHYRTMFGELPRDTRARRSTA